MKKENKLSALTLEELYAAKKKLGGWVVGFSIVMVLLGIVLVYLAVKSEMYALISVAAGGLLILLPGITRLGQVNAEIRSRKSA